MCRAVSGDGYSSRRLYTSDEDTIRSFIRCVSINGLNLGALQDDLLDRSLIINFKRISQENRKTEGKIWSRFQEILPSTLGSIFHIVSEAMKIYPTIKLNGNYRLADFIKWSCAITAAIEGECGVQNFINDYQRMVNQQEAASIDDNVLLTSLQHFFNRFDSWSGTPTQLYNLLSTIAAFHKLDVKHESWPKAPNYLSKALRAYQALLKDTGYVIDQTQRSSTERIIRLSKKERPNDAEPMEVITKDNVTESITVK